jgi:hypothetical protein
MPEDLAEKADGIARGRGISVNALMLEASQPRSSGSVRTTSSWLAFASSPNETKRSSTV